MLGSVAGLWQSQYSGDSWDTLASWTVRISDGFNGSPASLNKVESYRDRQVNVNFWPLHMCAHACTRQVQGQRVLSGPRPRARKGRSVPSGSSFWGVVYRRSPVPNTQRAEGVTSQYGRMAGLLWVPSKVQGTEWRQHSGGTSTNRHNTDHKKNTRQTQVAKNRPVNITIPNVKRRLGNCTRLKETTVHE